MTVDKYNEILPTRIRALIADSGATQNQIAKEIGVTRQSISQYCDGSTVPNADKLLKLAQYFNVSADYLLGLTEAKTNNKDVQFICDYTGLNESVIASLADRELPNYIAQMLNLLSQSFESEYLCKSIINFLNTENLEIRGTDFFDFGNMDCIYNAPKLNWLFYKSVESSGDTTISQEKIDNSFWENYFLIEVQKTLTKAKAQINKSTDK